jgi:type II secretory pathway pseudopilin PulG
MNLLRLVRRRRLTRAAGATAVVTGRVHEAGFSLLELLVATACTTMISGAVFSLLVGSAAAERRECSALAARRAADAAVAAIVDDLHRAGNGLESAGAVQVGGVRVPAAASATEGTLTVVRALGAAVEIRQAGPGSRFVVDSAALAAGDAVVAVGLVGRPGSAPLPLGVVTVVGRRGAGAEVWVAWRAAEAASLAAWGAPRALLPVEIRAYDLRAFEGALQLGRRTDGGPRQPVADGLDELRLLWIVDTDGDGRADARRDVFAAGSGERACAVRVEARATPSRTRLAPAPAAAGTRAEVATRWVTLGGC